MQSRVDKLKQDLETLRANSLGTLEPSLTSTERMRALHKNLEYLTELDAGEFSTVLTPTSIKDYKKQANAAALALDFEVEAAQQSYTESTAMISSLTTAIAAIDFADLSAQAEKLDNLKRDIIQSIKDTLISYYTFNKAKIETEVGQQVIKSPTSDGAVRAGSPELEKIAKLLCSPFEMTKHAIESVNANVKTGVVLNQQEMFTCQVSGSGLRFNDALEKLSLAELINYANEVMWATWANKSYADHFLSLKHPALGLQCTWTMGKTGPYYYLQMDNNVENSFLAAITKKETEVIVLTDQAEKLPNVAGMAATAAAKIEDKTQVIVLKANEELKAANRTFVKLQKVIESRKKRLQSLIEKVAALNNLLINVVSDDNDAALIKARYEEVANIVVEEEEAVNAASQRFSSDTQSVRYSELKARFINVQQSSLKELSEAKLILGKVTEALENYEDEKSQRADAAEMHREIEAKLEQARQEKSQQEAEEFAHALRASPELAAFNENLTAAKEIFAKMSGDLSSTTFRKDTLEIKKALLVLDKQHEGIHSSEQSKHKQRLVSELKSLKLAVSHCVTRFEDKKTAELKPTFTTIRAEQDRVTNDLLNILQVILQDKNIINFWKHQVSFMGKLNAHKDGACVVINGTKHVVPRGIYQARKALDKLSDPDANKADIVKEACMAMKNRWDRDKTHARKSPTADLYLEVVNLFPKKLFEPDEANVAQLQVALSKQAFYTPEMQHEFELKKQK